MEYPFKDLLPLDEVLEREGYYKDWTHLDPEVFYSLTQISNFIKTKGYGVDVRLLIAQLAEHFGLKTTQVVDLANLLQQKFTNLEGVTQSFTKNINSLVAQMEADKNTIVANATVDSEVILARGGKATLGQRLDDTSAQLSQIAYSVKSFGAVGDGVTDDTTAINNAISYISTIERPTLLFPYSEGGFLVTDTIAIPKHMNVIMESELVYGGIQDRPALLIGDYTTYNHECEFKIRVRSKVVTTKNDNYIGVEIINAYNCRIDILSVFGFTEGYRAMATKGFTMNLTNLGRFKDNLINIRITNKENGWNNGNDYFGGIIGGFGQNEVIAVQIDSLDESYLGNNSNVFYSPKFEMGPLGTPVVINNGNNNIFMECRTENNSREHFAVIRGLSYENKFSFSSVISSTEIINYSRDARQYSATKQKSLIFDSGDLAKKALTNSSGDVVIPNLAFASYYSTDNNEKATFATAELAENGVKLKNGQTAISLYVDTSKVKTFHLEAGNYKNTELNIFLACYLADGSQVSNTDLPILNDDSWGMNTYVKHRHNAGVSYYAGYGGVYKIPDLPTLGQRIFTVKNEVEKIRILVTSGKVEDPLILKNIKLYTYAENSGSSVYDGLGHRTYIQSDGELYKIDIDSSGAVIANLI